MKLIFQSLLNTKESTFDIFWRGYCPAIQETPFGRLAVLIVDPRWEVGRSIDDSLIGKYLSMSFKTGCPSSEITTISRYIHKVFHYHG